MADAHGRGGTGDTGKVVMLGQPEAPVAGGLGVLGKIEGIGQRIGGRESLADIGEVEDGEVGHPGVGP